MKLKKRARITPGDTAEQIVEKILSQRKVVTKAQKQAFLNPEKPSIKLLQQKYKIEKNILERTKKRIEQAIRDKEDVCVYGDYDVDGVTSTAILWNTLNDLGARVLPFIPQREKHGYGLSRKGLDDIFSGKAFQDSTLSPFKPSLMITTDNGIVAHDEVKRLKDKGVDVIISDHHKKEDRLPKADIIIHTTETSAAGIAWLIALYLMNNTKQAYNYIDLATIGIVADMMPLVGVNRNIVVHGLKELKTTSRKGLQSLYEKAGIQGKDITTYDINFCIAPRLNAMGRLEHALDTLRLLCTRDASQAEALADTLEHVNKRRQDMTDDALAHAQKLIDANKLMFVASDAYHEGIVGLIAGKLTEETGKPAIAIAIGEKIAKGSARSIKGLDITDLLNANRKWLTAVGGHEMAAGFSLDPNNIEAFRESLLKQAEKEISNELLQRSVVVEGEILLKQVTKSLYRSLARLQPFGIGNPRPKFIASNSTILDERAVGKEGKHKKMIVAQGSVSREAIWFNADDRIKNPKNIIFSVDLNVWDHKETLQLMVDHAY